MYLIIYTFSHTLDPETSLAFFYMKPHFFKRGKLELPSAVAAQKLFLHAAYSDALTFADTPVNLLFRPEGSLVEQNLSNGKSYLSEIMRKIYLSGRFFNGSRVIRKCPAGGQLQDQPDSSK